MIAYRFTLSGLLGMAGSSLSATVLGTFFGQLSFPVALIALAVGCGLAVAGWRSAAPTPSPKPSLLEWILIIFFAAACLRSFLWLTTWDGDQLKVLSRNNLGDLSLHWHYIQYLASGSNFWPDNPTLTGVAIRYPLGVDLFNALLLICGVPLMRGLVWVGLAGSFFAGYALFRWGRAFAIAGLLFNGGVTGFAFFFTWQLQDFQAALAWKNLFLAIFVTQRGFLFCLPAALLLLDSWRSRISGQAPPMPFWCELVLYSVMPLFHFHTFLFLSITLGTSVLLGKNQLRPHALQLVAIALVPATWLTLLVTENFKASGVISLKPGWMQEDIPFLQFWFGNFGLWLFLWLVLLLLALRRKDPELRAFLFPSLLVFALCSLFLFAPWDWDNTKLLIWAYLSSLPVIWQHLVSPLSSWLRVGVCFVTFFSGAVSLLGGLREPGFHLAYRSEIDALRQPLTAISVRETIAAAPEYNHPLVYLGRKMVMGYEGHLFGHGLPYADVHRDLKALMLGLPEWQQAARRLGATYLFWGPHEAKAFPESTKAWEKSCQIVIETPSGPLYRLPSSAD